MFDKMLSGKDGSATYEVGGGNRIPLGNNSTVAAHSGHDLTLTIDRDVQWYTQRVLAPAVQGSGGLVRLRRGDGHPHRRAARPRRLPDLRRQPAVPVAGEGPRSRALRDVYEPGSVEKVLTASSLIDAGKVTPDTQITVPAQLPAQDRVIHDYFPHGQLHLTLTGVIAKSSNIGTVLAASQFKHQAALRLPAQVRPRPAHRDRRARASPRRAHRLEELAGDQPGHHRLRPGPRGERRADGRRGQRRSPTAASTSSPAWSRGRRPPPRQRRSDPHLATTHRVVSPARRQADRADDGVGDQPGDRHRARGRRSTATGSPARPAPRSGSARTAAATTARSRSPSPGSRPPTTRGSWSTSWSRTRRTAAVAARSVDPRSARS